MKKNLFVLIGPAGVGKSTYIANHKKQNDVVVSSDEIRKELKSIDQSNSLVFDQMQVDAIANHDNNVFYDATNLTRKYRIPLYNKMKAYFHVVAVFLYKPLKTVLENNKNRTAVVPEDVVIRMYKSIEVPRLGVDCDEIFVVNQNINDFNEEINATINQPHFSPWHAETLQEHIDLCVENAGDDPILIELAKYHDLGKSICRINAKITNEDKQKFFDTYHHYDQFISHDKVSAALYLVRVGNDINNDKNKQDILETIFQHMHVHLKQISEKTIKRNKLDSNLLELMQRFALLDDQSRIDNSVLSL